MAFWSLARRRGVAAQAARRPQGDGTARAARRRCCAGASGAASFLGTQSAWGGREQSVRVEQEEGRRKEKEGEKEKEKGKEKKKRKRREGGKIERAAVGGIRGDVDHARRSGDTQRNTWDEKKKEKGL